ncbi:unnamed protein product [Amoebophrya sp. A120]|nr:unnamed protein product [Amoebophrya sp. A120]|eukprot:GSA120T00004512001.1
MFVHLAAFPPLKALWTFYCQSCPGMQLQAAAKSAKVITDAGSIVPVVQSPIPGTKVTDLVAPVTTHLSLQAQSLFSYGTKLLLQWSATFAKVSVLYGYASLSNREVFDIYHERQEF